MGNRFNYTGRRRIFAKDIAISVDPAQDGRLEFHATATLAPYGFPPAAELLIEAYRASRYQRFDFGTVAAADDTLDGVLESFRPGELPLFRVKVVDNTDRRGILLGEADKIQPTGNPRGPGARISLLPTESTDLGPEVWRLSLEGAPVLQVNREIGDWRGLVRSRAFDTIAYPLILRMVLLEIVVEAETVPGDDGPRWHQLWLRFAAGIRGAPPFPSEPVNEEMRGAWVGDVVEAFCRVRNTLSTAITLFGSDAA